MIDILGIDAATWQLIGIGVAIILALASAAWYIAKFEADNEEPDYKNDFRK